MPPRSESIGLAARPPACIYTKENLTSLAAPLQKNDLQSVKRRKRILNARQKRQVNDLADRRIWRTGFFFAAVILLAAAAKAGASAALPKLKSETQAAFDRYVQ